MTSASVRRVGDRTFEDVLALLDRATGDEKHAESSTSTLDALWVLYDRILRVDPERPDRDDRDRFILSKGHGPAAYYSILAAKGFFPEESLHTFLDFDSSLGAHPDRLLVPGVEASTGSLGHGLPIGLGTALALRARGFTDPRVFVLCGDAELNEGSNWEAILLAGHLRISSLTLLVIDNHSSNIEMGPWDARLGAFGWNVRQVDGHDHEQLFEALSPRDSERPVAVIAAIPAGEW